MSESLAFVFDLPPADKLQLVQDLWDDLAANAADVPVEQWQIDELERRAANLKANPESALTWEEVKRQIRSRYGR
jgi:putative addiction module component (TIGR02574 family)